MHPKKKRKVCGTFENLIDLEIPLWKDVFSIVFCFLTNQEIFSVLLSSKAFLELVKARAVFHEEVSYDSTKPSSTNKFREFYFSEVILSGKITREDFRFLHRQHYLTRICLGSELESIDLRMFLERGGEGRRYFPRVKYLNYVGMEHNTLGEHNFWEFLREFSKIRPLCFVSTHGVFSLEDLKHLVELGKFDILGISLANTLYLSEEDLKPLEKIEARRVQLWSILRRNVNLGMHFSKIVKSLQENVNIEKITVLQMYPDPDPTELDYFRYHYIAQFLEMLTNEKYFKGLKSILWTSADFSKRSKFGETLKMLVKKKSLERIMFWGVMKDNFENNPGELDGEVNDQCLEVDLEQILTLRGFCEENGWEFVFNTKRKEIVVKRNVIDVFIQ